MFFNKFGDFDVLRMAADSAVLQNVKATFEEKKQNLSACIIEIKCTIHKRAASGHYGVKKKKKRQSPCLQLLLSLFVLHF